jgi:hypothetical protein
VSEPIQNLFELNDSYNTIFEIVKKDHFSITGEVVLKFPSFKARTADY